MSSIAGFRNRGCIHAVWCFVLAAAAIPCVYGQGSTATISGTVTDMSGAAIGEASIQVRNVGTGISQSVASNAQGRYQVPDLAIGVYDVQASKTGFQTVVHTGITLTVGSQPVVDFSLPVGQAQQTVTVESEVSQVETQSTDVGALVESKQVTELPLNGRNFTQLLTLAPGVVQIPQGAPGAGNTFYGNGQKYTIAGSRPSGQPYLLDDQDMVNFWNNGPGAGGLGTALGVEAIAEFQTLTHNYSAQFGGNGAVINASSKSGTNGFHGSAFEFLRNDKLESRNFYDGANPPTFRRNQFGGSFGGPIKKDKAFFFVNYEALRQTQVVTNLVTVPDACAHQFLTSTPVAGACGAPVPQNNTPFATNPATQTAIRNAMALYPMPFNENLTATGGPSGTGLASVLDPNIGKENYVLGRVDYNLSSKDSLFVRYVYDWANRDFTNGVPWWPELDRTRDHFISLEERRIISANVVNVAHFSYSRTYEDAYVYGSPTVANGVVSRGTIATPVTSGTTSAGVHPLQFFNSDPSSLFFANSTAGQGVPREDGQLSSFSGITAIGASPTLPFYLVPNKFVYGDDVIWTSGTHSIKFGADAMRLRENTWAPFIVGGNWFFPSLTGFMQGSAAQVQGQVSDVQNPLADATKDYRYWVFSPYIDDQWKATSKLTVNLGLRYEPTTIISQVRHEMLNIKNLPYGTYEPVTQATAVNPSLKNFDPRVGLAWDPFANHKTSVRASFGLFHSVIFSRDTNHWLQPPFYTATQTAATGLVYPFLYSNVPRNVQAPLDGTVSCTNCDYYGVHSTPYQMQWDLSIEREVMANTVLSLGYIGSHGVHLWLQRDFNYPTPCVQSQSELPNSPVMLAGQTGCFYNGAPTFSNAQGVPNPRLNPLYNSQQMADTQGSSRYHALQASLNRRFSAGLQFLVTYTWSKSIDNSSGTYGLDGGGAVSNPTNLNADWGLSNFNRASNLRISGIYDLPYKGKGVAGQLLGGWQITGIFSYLSGAPVYPIQSATNRVFSGTGANFGRPNVVAGCDPTGPGFQQLHGLWYNPACFALQPLGTYGNAGRDNIIGPNLWDLDDSLSKDWKFKEAASLQFRAEGFNILNHPSFQNPGATIFAGTAFVGNAGRITATNSSPRQIQLALKLIF
ncbi:MAG TPA: carboxypeptidase regulatory-like domain-containing protein [Bryobacteraceae bacterium]|nr:carboxypeptidase regulatory-like domain-containing protein [Bryobacteraceae bacterium]